MQICNFFHLASLAVHSLLVASALGERCKYSASPEMTAMIQAVSQKAAYELSYAVKTRNIESTTINVRFHVFAPYNDTQPPVESKHLSTILKVVQDSFQPYGIKFRRDAKDSWHAKPPYPLDESAWLSALGDTHSGEFATLNINVFPEIFPGSDGTTFGLTRVQTDIRRDGVSIIYDVLPDYSYAAAFPEVKMGKTLVHEIGHWLGLFHPFMFGCDKAPQVYIGVPRQDKVVNEYLQHLCYVSVDTCPNDEGNDPLNNYMNYMDDRCLKEFTPAQVKIMHGVMKERRKLDKTGKFDLKHWYDHGNLN